MTNLIRLMLVGVLCLSTPLAAQDGTVYRPSMSPLSYALVKSTLSSSLYLVGRELGLGRSVAALAAIGLPTAIGKAVAWHQGHRVPWQDIVGDLAWSGLLVIPIATRSIRWSVLTVSVIVVTCSKSSPRICG